MRVLIAPDKLRGTYTAAEACAAIARGWLQERPADDLDRLPLADGGEGTAAALIGAHGGEWRQVEVHDALGRPCLARFAQLADGSAAVDAAEACGLWRVADRPLDPLGASSRGAGELIAAAVNLGATRVVVGVGGTASTDGGAGLREGLGELPANVTLVAALDVDSPLCGPRGAAAVYGPHKGATAADVELLEDRLRALDLPTADRPGAGAGGGIGGMLMALGADARPGAQLVMQEVGFDGRLREAGLCITGEGRIDAQTLHGKVVAVVADKCAACGVPCVAVAGQIEAPAAEELRRRGCDTHEQGDLELAGRELARSRGSA